MAVTGGGCATNNENREKKCSLAAATALCRRLWIRAPTERGGYSAGICVEHYAGRAEITC
jgi:hypothetical protein